MAQNEITKKPILTVAIPTYNRPEHLEKTLIELINQRDDLFQILISDDSTNNLTETLVKRYQANIPNIIYHKNPKNLGFSLNVLNLYELADTRYIWFLCDDDVVLGGAIKKIISAITKYQPTVAIFNCEWIDSYGRLLIAGPSEDKSYNDVTELESYNVLMRLTFLSIIVLERRIPLGSLKEKNISDNVFVQITMALMLLADGFKLCEVSSNILHRNVGYKYGEFLKFHIVDTLKAISLAKHVFENKKFILWHIKHIPVALQVYVSQKIGLFKYSGWPTKDTLINVIYFYKLLSVPIFVALIVLSLVPGSFVKGMYFMRLVKYHGYKAAKQVYLENVNRAIKDGRQSRFPSYR